jgi:hypothetical protein
MMKGAGAGEGIRVGSGLGSTSGLGRGVAGAEQDVNKTTSRKSPEKNRGMLSKSEV